MHSRAGIEKCAYISIYLYIHVYMRVNLDSTHERKHDILGGSILDMREMCSDNHLAKVTPLLNLNAQLFRFKTGLFSLHFLSSTHFLLLMERIFYFILQRRLNRENG